MLGRAEEKALKKKSSVKWIAKKSAAKMPIQKTKKGVAEVATAIVAAMFRLLSSPF